MTATKRSSDASSVGETRPAQRRKVVEGNFGPVDIILISRDGIEFEAHKTVLNIACGNFTLILDRALAAPISPPPVVVDKEDFLPPPLRPPPTRIALPCLASTIEAVLPLAYRAHPGSFRSRPYSELEAAIRLAHYLGLPAIVEVLSMYLEQHIPKHGVALHTLAVQLQLDNLKISTTPSALVAQDLHHPLQRAQELGLAESLELHRTRSLDLFRFHVGVKADFAKLSNSIQAADSMRGHDLRHQQILGWFNHLLSLLPTVTYGGSSTTMVAPSELVQLLVEMDDVEQELKFSLSKKTGCEVCSQSALAYTKLREGYRKLFPPEVIDKVLV